MRRAAVPFRRQVRRGVRLAQFRRRDSGRRDADARRRRTAHRDHLRQMRGSLGTCVCRRGIYTEEYAPLRQFGFASLRTRSESRRTAGRRRGAGAEKGGARNRDFRRRLFLGRGVPAVQDARRAEGRIGLHRRQDRKPHLRAGVQPYHGACRSGARDVRSGEGVV